MVQRGATEHEIERCIDEGKCGRVTFLEQHVVDAGGAQPLRTDGQQCGREIDSHNLANMRCRDLRCVGCAARHVEHDHSGVERLEPSQGRCGPAREQRVVAHEETDLLLERLAGDVVMVLCAHLFIIYGVAVTVSARPAKYLPVAANIDHQPDGRGQAGVGVVDMREGSRVRAGTFAYDGGDFVTDWHSHDLHQIEYAFEGIAEVETDGAHYLLPPQQAVWIPAGLTHRTTLKHVRSVAVFFDPAMVEGANDRVRILAATPLIREMIVHAARWPIGRQSSDQIADAFFEALALLVVDWLAHETPLCLPTSNDPVLRAVMDFTNANLADASIVAVCAAVGISERTLRRQFGAETGMTWRQYVLQSRLMRSMALLTDPGRTVIDVATEIGFESVSAFTRAFVRSFDQ